MPPKPKRESIVTTRKQKEELAKQAIAARERTIATTPPSSPVTKKVTSPPLTDPSQTKATSSTSPSATSTVTGLSTSAESDSKEEQGPARIRIVTPTATTAATPLMSTTPTVGGATTAATAASKVASTTATTAATAAAATTAAATTTTPAATTAITTVGGATAVLPASIPGETLIQVNIGQRPFFIGSGPAAETRRRAYFTTPRTTGSLVRGEQEIIDYFGIDALGMAIQLMPDFFKDLPSCTSDTKAFTNKKCQSVYQTLWMTKMSRTTKAQAALTADLTALQPFGNDTNALDLAQLNALMNLTHRDMLTIRVRELANVYRIPILP